MQRLGYRMVKRSVNLKIAKNFFIIKASALKYMSKIKINYFYIFPTSFSKLLKLVI